MRTFVSSLWVFLAVVLIPARVVHADPKSEVIAPARSPADPNRGFFVGLSGGVGWAHIKHKDLVNPTFVGPTLGLHAGYRATPQWSFGIDFSTVEHGVERVANVGYTTDSLANAQAGCNKCTQPPAGGIPSATMLLVAVGGPLVEFTPFGPEGFYLGASGGFAMVQLAKYFPGAGGTFRTGYRIHVGEIFNLALEAGTRAQYADGAGYVVYGAALFRPRF